jgi:hypothetical protein
LLEVPVQAITAPGITKPRTKRNACIAEPQSEHGCRTVQVSEARDHGRKLEVAKIAREHVVVLAERSPLERKDRWRRRRDGGDGRPADQRFVT